MTARSFNRFAKTAGLLLGPALLAGCATTQLNNDSCMRSSFHSLGVVGGGGSSYDANCGDAKTAELLLRRENDPVGNALGFLLYLDQNPKAKAQLESRLGGRENLNVSADTVATLLASTDTSRYVGVQLYAHIDADKRKDVDTLLKKQGLDPKAVLTLNNDDLRAASEARTWARDHATNPATSQCRQVTTTTSGNVRQIRFVCGAN